MSLSRLPGFLPPVLAAALAGLMLLPSAVLAQTEAAPTPAAPVSPSPDDVVATIGENTLTEADIAFANEDLGEELSTIPAAQRRAFLVGILVDMKVMAEAARADKLDETDLFKQRLSYLQDRALRNAYLTQSINSAITDEAVKAIYDKYVANFQSEEEVRARHILVSTEEDAEAVKTEIEGGKPFEIAALEYSQDDSATTGGDLGYFSRTAPIVQPFLDAAFALEVGQTSDPVQTRYGWHIIRIDDKRMSSPLPVDQILPQLQQQVMIDAFSAELVRLKKDITITFTDPALEAAVMAESAAIVKAEE
jgi:peptidyl-prolyl cis-trans isomerase C